MIALNRLSVIGPV